MNKAEILNKTIESNISAIRSKRAKMIMESDPLSIENDKKKNISNIDTAIIELKCYLVDLLEYIENIGKNVNDITSRDINTAIYLLLNQNVELWNSILVLMKEYKYSAILILMRSINEIGMLINHFVIQFENLNVKDLSSWFDGNIITHGEGRKSSQEFANKDFYHKPVNVELISSLIYQIQSQAPHGSYASILENISPFSEDFDYHGYTRFHRINSLIPSLKVSMTDLNIKLKMIYKFLLNDMESHKRLSSLLYRFDPKIASGNIDPEIAKHFKK